MLQDAGIKLSSVASTVLSVDPRPHRLEEGIATLSARIEEQLAPFADKG